MSSYRVKKSSERFAKQNSRSFRVHSFKMQKVRIDSVDRIHKYSKVVKNFIRAQRRKYSCDLCEILAGSILGINLSNKENRMQYLYPFSNSRTKKVLRTDGRLPDQEYICMSIPISIISHFSPSYDKS